MSKSETPESWLRLIALLEPIHAEARASARRLSRGPADGDDLFQEAVMRAHAGLASLRDESRFRSWFHSIILSVHKNRWRSAFWRRFLPLEGPDVRGWEPAGPDGAAWDADRSGAERASRALATLPIEQRHALVLFEIDGFSIEEIATIQNASVSAVKSRLSRGRQRLRRHYERLGFRTSTAVLKSGGGLPLSEEGRS